MDEGEIRKLVKRLRTKDRLGRLKDPRAWDEVSVQFEDVVWKRALESGLSIQDATVAVREMWQHAPERIEELTDSRNLESWLKDITDDACSNLLNRRVPTAAGVSIPWERLAEQLVGSLLERIKDGNNQPRPEAVVLGRPPRGGRLREVAPVGGFEPDNPQGVFYVR
jgi:hypothetical protein